MSARLLFSEIVFRCFFVQILSILDCIHRINEGSVYVQQMVTGVIRKGAEKCIFCNEVYRGSVSATGTLKCMYMYM
jgi:hypothetical protein